jgi:hypothetical protein
MTQYFCPQSRQYKSLMIAASLFAFVGCGADTGGDYKITLDAGVQDAAEPDAPSGLDSFFATESRLPPPTTDAAVDAQPTVSVDPTVAFAEIVGTYAAKGANVSGSGLPLFDNGQPYTFTIAADGTATFNSKTVAQVFRWSTDGKRIVRNTKNNVTVIEMEEPMKRILTITYHPTNGPFDIAGVIVEPAGRWYLSSIVKK